MNKYLPPITAVNLVDFRLQTPIVIGLINNATAADNAPTHPAMIRKNKIKRR